MLERSRSWTPLLRSTRPQGRTPPASRKVTLVAADGSRNTFTALPSDRTFDQLKVGEQVQATVTRQLVVFLRKNGVALNNAPMIEAGLAPDIAGSDVLKSGTVQRVAR